VEALQRSAVKIDSEQETTRQSWAPAAAVPHPSGRLLDGHESRHLFRLARSDKLIDENIFSTASSLGPAY
jgi:hypothetical protein